MLRLAASLAGLTGHGILNEPSSGLSLGGAPSACDIAPIAREPRSGVEARIVPTTFDGGVVVAFQDSDAIWLQEFDRECKSTGVKVQVNQSADFLRLRGGLWDSAGLPGGHGEVAVAWVLGGDVWVRATKLGDSKGGEAPAVQANSASFTASEPLVVASPASVTDGGFVVAWSSWAEDGDGWGVFARRIGVDRRPKGPEIQVNVGWRGFQWRPRLRWCGQALYALWTNSSRACADGGCASNAVLRRLAFAANGSSWDLGPEVAMGTLDEQNFAAVGLDCELEGNGADADNAVVIWLQENGDKVVWKHVTPSGEIKAEAVQQAPAPGLLAHRRLSLPTSTGLTLGEAPSLEAGEIGLLASKGLMVLLHNTAHGSLQAQLLDYGRHKNPVAYEQRQVAAGTREVRGAWDYLDATTPANAAVVLCFAAGGVLEESTDKPHFSCLRRQAHWLAEPGPIDFGGAVTTMICLGAIVAVLWLRPCAPGGYLSGRLFRDRGRGGFGARRLARETPAAQRGRLRELRQQLAAIPAAPPAPPQPLRTEAPGTTAAVAPEEGGCGDSAVPAAAAAPGVSASTCGSDPACCAICHAEVVVRVALQPCGHTACRDCILRLVELNQRCHICRSVIEGVLPVYI